MIIKKNIYFQKTHLMIMPTLDETQNNSIEGIWYSLY